MDFIARATKELQDVLQGALSNLWDLDLEYDGCLFQFTYSLKEQSQIQVCNFY